MQAIRTIASIAIVTSMIWAAFFVPVQWEQTRTAYLVNAANETRSAGAGANASSASCNTTNTFSNLTNIGANDTNYAIITTPANFDTTEKTQFLEGSSFGFTTAGTIDGIQFDVLGWVTTASDAIRLVSIRLMTSSTVYVGSDPGGSLVLFPTADPGSTYMSFGGAADTWGAGLTSSQINASTFGAAICFEAAGDNVAMNVDHYQMTVTYTATVAEQVFAEIIWFF